MRTLFGIIYIGIPHLFLLMFLGIWGSILSFISFWIILFTGRYPESFFEFQVKLMKWNLRVNSSLLNLIDGYPAFGLSSEHEDIELNVEFPESLSRGKLLLKFFFGWLYVLIPHVIAMYFLMVISAIINFIAFWAILFTGRYPQSMFDFQVGFMRWSTRVNLYLNNMTDVYPPFSLSN
jgi:hypothetical protein